MPEEFGPYLLEEEIGRGGMGVVYRAYDTRRDRRVALKRLPRELSDDETFQARFRRESRLAARLNEPHIIPIHDFGEIEGALYLDMRLVEGTDLGSLISLRSNSLTPTLAVDIIGQVASALTAAHDAGLVHRDVKPSNVLISGLRAGSDTDDEDAFAYLVDFGIARGRPGAEGTALTMNTETVGTLDYMAPERISGASGDYRSDIYSLACMLYECLTGHTPFAGESFQVMFAHVNTPPPPASAGRPGLPPALDAVLLRGMAKDPDTRYASARQLASAARAALATRAPAPSGLAPPTSPPRAASGPAFGPTPSPLRPVQPAWTAPPPPARVPPPPPANWPGGGSPPPSSWSGGSTPPQHPSGPLPRPISPMSGPVPHRRNRRLLLAAVIAVVAVMTGVVVAVVASGGGGSPAASTTPTPTPLTTSSSRDFPTSSASTSSAATPAQWSDFDDFTTLVGNADGDTASTFKNAYCALHGSDGTPGMIDRVECTAIKNSPVTYSVARFSRASMLTAYLSGLTSDKGYRVRNWDLPKINKSPRGRLYSSPSTAAFVDVSSSICALPTYLVQFYVAPGASLSVADVEKNFWGESRFPDSVPAKCK